ncbi:MAG: OmpA family protein [Myxococcales bacterium]|nr:OmpA family protein [Myxococcales bacterium]
MALSTSACGTAGTPKQLLDARAAYSAAEAGPAKTLTPAELVDAKKSLDEAEQTFLDDGASDKTVDAAYVAQRRAELADARGRIADGEAAAVRNRAELASVNASRLSATENALDQSRGEVARKGQELALTGAELRATGSALVREKQALAQEKKARALAEARLKDAMDKLALAASLSVKEEPRGTVITLPSNVLFATAKWVLLPGSMSKLDAVAVALKDQPDVTIKVEGHTDSQGTPEANNLLATRRAESVRAYLESKGVAKDQLSATGLGEDRPIGDNKTTDGRAQNRRVEIVVTPREKR